MILLKRVRTLRRWAQGERQFPRSKKDALGALYSPLSLKTNPGAKLFIDAAAPSSLRFQYSKYWTLASIAKPV